MPALITALFFRQRWQWAFITLIATMLVDVDHLLANPIYDPTRCSINFHPLHGFVPIAGYFLLCIPARLRLIGIGLLLHMVLDAIDCQWTNGLWYQR